MSHINPDGTDLDGVKRKTDPPLLHLYAGPSFHMEGYVVGNREGLTKLRDALNRVLDSPGDHNASVTDEEKPTGTGVFVSDGEGYDIYVIRQDTSWQEDPWANMAYPYTDEDGLCQIREDAIWPHALITEEEQHRLLRGYRHIGPYHISEERAKEINDYVEKILPDDGKPQDDY